jgi:predicted phage gp36 major capsid-like protein
MRTSNFALRLQNSLMKEARRAAQKEGVALNQLINVAVAEKLSALRAEMRFRRLASRADRRQTLEVLKRAGNDNPPRPGDEIPRAKGIRRRPTEKKRRKAVGGAVGL